MPNLGRLLGLLFWRGWISVRGNLALAVISLALAFALWVFVTDTENPKRTDFFPGAIAVQPVNVPPGMAVASLSDAAVSVRLSAPEDDWKDLTTANFQAIVDLAGVSVRQATITVLVSTEGARSAEVVEVSPPRIEVALEPVATKVMPVRVKLVGAPPAGFEPAPATFRPEEVTATGPESLINLVTEAVADVNLTGLRVSLTQLAPLAARDGRGNDVSNIVLDPAMAEVDLPIVQREVSLAFVVKPAIRGLPAEGYNVASVQLDPPFVVISGPIEVLQSVTELVTDEVDISGASSDVERVVPLRLPAGVTTEGGDEVTVQVRVSPAQGEIVLGVAPSLTGLAPGLKGSIAVALVSVRVTGDLPTLTALTSNNLTAELDVSGLVEGVHTVPLRVEAPAGVRVESVDPPTVVVTITAA